MADRCRQLGRVVSDGFTGQPGGAGKEQWGAVSLRPSFVLGLLCLVLASTWRAAASPFRSSLTSSTTPQFAAEALQKTQFQQLSTARLLPGRSTRNWRRNGSELTFHSTELPGAAPTLAPEQQHQQWIHRTRVERLNWRTQRQSYAAIDMVRPHEAFSRQSLS